MGIPDGCIFESFSLMYSFLKRRDDTLCVDLYYLFILT